MDKRFQIAITDTELRYTRDTQRIAADAALDGGLCGPHECVWETLSRHRRRV